jgi:hypothetical protein
MNPEVAKLLEEWGKTPADTPSVTSLEGKALSSPVTQVDPDTVKVDGQSYRLEGFNAPETAKFQGGIFVPGQVAGDRTQEVVNRVAKAGGFNNLESTGKKDPYGRIVARQTNKAGENLGDLITALGITDPTLYTSDKVMSDRIMTEALMRVMPDLAGADPILKAAREEHQRRIKEAGGNPLYVPKLIARDEQQYKAAKELVGIQAAKTQLEEIDRLEGILVDPNLRPDTRAKLEKQLEEARDKLFIAGTTPDFVANVALRRNDRTIMNQAYNQFTTSFDNAVIDMKKGFYGFGEMLGEAQKWDWLTEKSKAGVLEAKAAVADAPEVLMSIRDVPGKDTWDTITNAATYAGNLVAGTLPMMSALVASTIATAPIGGIGGAALATLPGAVLYSGQFYADQPDDKKNPGLALSAGIGAATLDKLGLDAMLGANLFSKIGRQEVIQTMIQTGKAASVEQAEEILKQATKKTIIELSDGGAEFAAKHYATKQARIQALKAVGLGTIGEAGTETGQTLLELVARSGEVDPDIRYDKHFYTALIDAAVGGGLMGGAFTVGGVGLDMAQWQSAADAKRNYEKGLTDAQSYYAEQQQLKANNDPRAATSVLDALRVVTGQSPNTPFQDLESMPGRPGYWNGFLSVVKDPVRLLRGLADTTVRDLRKSNGELKQYLPMLKAIMRPGVLPGDHYDGFRQRIIGQWSTTDAATLATQLNTNTVEASKKLKEAWQTTWSQGNRLSGATPEEAILQAWKDEADNVSAAAMELMNAVGVNTAGTNSLDAVFEDAAVDPKKVALNEQRLVNTMVANGSSERLAREAVKNIVSGDPNLASPAKNWMSQYGVFRDPQLNDLFEPNVFDAFENFKHRIASNAAKEVYLGRDGSNLAKILQLARDNGEFESEAEYLDTVQNTKDFYKIATGEYNSLENYPFIEKLVGWGTTVTMLASLGKAAFSSLPEMALSTLGTPGQKVTTQLKNNVNTLLDEIRNDVNKGISYSTSVVGMAYARENPSGRVQNELNKLQAELDAVRNSPNPSQDTIDALNKKIKAIHKKAMGRSLFERLGYNDSGYNTQAKFETNTANMKTAMQVFSSFIGLRAVTDATRIATLSIAADIVRVRLAALQAIPAAERNARFSTGQNMTNEQYQSLKELQKYGMDVERTLAILDQMATITTNSNPVDLAMELASASSTSYLAGNPAQELKDNFLITLRNMVDSRIVNPQVGNLPKYYHDPRLRVFTAMTRFIAGLTANVLPRLYMDYIKDGNAGMRYQAFAVMMMAVTFAYLANGLKDMLAYGDDENPYLKSRGEVAQRALYGSGLLGRVEAVVDMFAPLYPNRKADPTTDPFEWAYDTVKGNAPPIGWADRAVRAMYQLGTGDTEQGVKNTVRSLPVVGSFPIAAETAAEQFRKE